MNKYQKALSLVIELIEIDNGCAGIFFKYNGEMFEAIDILKELVEKATPNKPILVHDYDGLVFECPICHEEFRPDTIMNHVKWKGCPYCLQNLDWSEEE